MDATTLAGLLLTLTTTSPDFPTRGTGFFEQILGDPNQVTWSIGGVVGGDVGNTGVGPGPCTSTCAFDFSATNVMLPPGTVSGYVMIPTLNLFGPRVIATAVCPGVPACLPGSRLYQTVWGSVPITVIGSVRFVSLSDPTDFLEMVIAGRGIALAENRVELSGVAQSTSRTRYDFTFEVAPEPASVVLVATGLLIIAVSVRRPRIRQRADCGA
jgi:hypothetical protein